MIYLQFSEYKNSKKNNTQTDFKVRFVSKFITSWTIDFILWKQELYSLFFIETIANKI